MIAKTPLKEQYKAFADETYRELEKEIEAVVWAFARKHGGDFEEWMSHALVAFTNGMIAITEGAPNLHADNSVELRRHVWFQLFDLHRTQSQHRRKDKCVIKQEERCDLLPTKTPGFNITDFLDGLTDDGKVAAKLVLDTPADIAAAARERGGSDRNLRSVIRHYLSGLGWHAERISNSFAEVGKALLS